MRISLSRGANQLAGPGLSGIAGGLLESVRSGAADVFFGSAYCNALALATMVWPMGWLSRRWFPQVPPILVQVIVVLTPLYLWYGTRIHHSAFVMAAHPWLVYGWLKWSHESLGRAIGIGVLTGLIALFQPTILGLYGMCGLVALSASLLGKNAGGNLALLAVAGISVVVCLVPWTIRTIRFMVSCFGSKAASARNSGWGTIHCHRHRLYHRGNGGSDQSILPKMFRGTAENSPGDQADGRRCRKRRWTMWRRIPARSSS